LIVKTEPEIALDQIRRTHRRSAFSFGGHLSVSAFGNARFLARSMYDTAKTHILPRACRMRLEASGRGRDFWLGSVASDCLLCRSWREAMCRRMTWRRL
jgi:hypothetical protein